MTTHHDRTALADALARVSDLDRRATQAGYTDTGELWELTLALVACASKVLGLPRCPKCGRDHHGTHGNRCTDCVRVNLARLRATP